MPASEPNPVLIEVTRGPAVESRHRGAIAVMNASGELLESWGDIETPVYPRSATKLLQALPLLESGAADRFKVSAQELALACASHGGTPNHVAVAHGWLTRLGLEEGDLVCGPHPPLDERAAAALYGRGIAPGRLHNNCSGKHLAMLTTALFHGEPTAGYSAPDHPVQARIRAVLEEMSGEPLGEAPIGTDGCGVPTIGLPLRGLARAMAKVAAPEKLPLARASSIRRLRVAVTMHPDMSGTAGRLTTELIRLKRHAVYAKGGAEGVCVAALPQFGIGLAIKIDDGTRRAADAVLAEMLEGLEVIDEVTGKVLEAYAPRTLRNHAGAPVGEVRPSEEWLR